MLIKIDPLLRALLKLVHVLLFHLHTRLPSLSTENLGSRDLLALLPTGHDGASFCRLRFRSHGSGTNVDQASEHGDDEETAQAHHPSELSLCRVCGGH